MTSRCVLFRRKWSECGYLRFVPFIPSNQNKNVVWVWASVSQPPGRGGFGGKVLAPLCTSQMAACTLPCRRDPLGSAPTLGAPKSPGGPVQVQALTQKGSGGPGGCISNKAPGAAPGPQKGGGIKSLANNEKLSKRERGQNTKF